MDNLEEILFFFFQAEDGIRDYKVTGVQTCALPIFRANCQPGGMAVSSDGARLYVANSVSGSVSVIETSSNAVVATITVGAGPGSMTITPDGTRIYVANS